jgi:hypothetical protein
MPRYEFTDRHLACAAIHILGEMCKRLFGEVPSISMAVNDGTKFELDCNGLVEWRPVKAGKANHLADEKEVDCTHPDELIEAP